MRPVSPIVGTDLQAVVSKVNELARASQDVTEEVADPFKVTNLSKLYTLDVGSASLEDLRRIVGTLINDLKTRGTHRVAGF